MAPKGSRIHFLAKFLVHSLLPGSNATGEGPTWQPSGRGDHWRLVPGVEDRICQLSLLSQCPPGALDDVRVCAYFFFKGEYLLAKFLQSRDARFGHVYR